LKCLVLAKRIAVMRGRFWTDAFLSTKKIDCHLEGEIALTAKIHDKEAVIRQEKQGEVEGYIRELFNERGGWGNQQEIARAINNRHGTNFVQSTIHRALDKMKAEKIEGEWTLEPDQLYANNLSDLQSFFKESVDNNVVFSKGLEIYMLKTKPYFNAILAKKIQDTFKDEICCVMCPNPTDLMIFSGGSPCGKNSASREFEKEISKMIKHEKSRSEDNS
jgi:arginine repressor